MFPAVEKDVQKGFGEEDGEHRYTRYQATHCRKYQRNIQYTHRHTLLLSKVDSVSFFASVTQPEIDVQKFRVRLLTNLLQISWDPLTYWLPGNMILKLEIQTFFEFSLLTMLC